MDVMVLLRVLVTLIAILLGTAWASALCHRFGQSMQGILRKISEAASVTILALGILAVIGLVGGLAFEACSALVQSIRGVATQWQNGNHGPALGMLIGLGLGSVLLWLYWKIAGGPVNRFADKAFLSLFPRETVQREASK